MSEVDSLKKRYTSKLFNNFFGALLSFISLPLISRALGPQGLGSYDYSTESMRLILDILSLGVPMATFAWISGEKGERARIGMILGLVFAFIVCFLGAATIATTQILGVTHLIWPEISVNFLYIGLLTQSSVFIQSFISQWADGLGFTTVMERSRSVQNIIRTSLTIWLALTGYLTLNNYFHLQWLTTASLTMVAAYFLLAKSKWKLKISKRNLDDIKDYTTFTVKYVTPLIVMSLFTFTSDFSSGWLLQKFGGAAERGNFGLSARVGNIIFLFASALTPIMIRELAIATKIANNDLVSSLFMKAKSIIFLTAVIGIFSAFHPTELASALGGQSFAEASLPVAIYCLYPIHQVFGQLTGSYFLGSGQTKIYSFWAIIFSVLSIPVSYFLIAPTSALIPGLNLAALGRALQMVLIQILSTNLMLLIVCRKTGMNFWHWLIFQILIISSLSFFALISKALPIKIAPLLGPIVPFMGDDCLALLISGTFYCFMATVLLYAFPSLAGFRRDALRNFVLGLVSKSFK